MKVLQLLVLSVLFFISFTKLIQADEKIIMKSGAVYIGETIDESDTYIQLRQINSEITIEIEKSKIDKIQPALCRIVTNQNYEIFGNIIERQRMVYKVKTSDGVVIDVDRSGVLSIDYVNEEDFNNWTNPVSPIRKIEVQDETKSNNSNDINKNIVQKDTYSKYYEQTYNQNFPYAGITLGTPGMFNLALGYHLESIIFELKGGAGDEYAGVQSSMLLNIYETDDCIFGMSVGLSLGYMSHKRKEHFYEIDGNSFRSYDKYFYDKYFFTGATIRIQWYGVTFDIGIATSIMSDNPEVDESFALANLGYMYYFN